MKHLLSLLLFVLFDTIVNAQTLTGTYETQDQKLTFYGDSVQFDLSTRGCLVYDYHGKGTYRIIKNRLLIQPEVQKKNAEFKVESVTAKNKDSIRFVVSDASSGQPPVIGASVLIIRDRRTASGVSTNSGGMARLARKQLLNTDSVRISMIGYHRVQFKAESWDADYNILMFPGPDEQHKQAYVTNKGKGYPFKLSGDQLKVDFKQPGSCGSHDWLVFNRKNG